ncbi:MAG: flagellar export protein FliJ, partial [Hyphomicrobium sp.]
TGVKDPAHFAYSTFARSAGQRRDNLRNSVAGLMAKLEAAQRERDEALEQLTLADAPATREELRNRRRAERLASATLR